MSLLGSERRLFGTDGIRGVANVDLTPDLALDLARAAGELLHGDLVLVGRDTRRSGDMLSEALQAGFHSVGVDTIDVGVMPSGGISHLTNTTSAAMGVVVSASHNPASDNGIKLLDRLGRKLNDDEEARIEARMRQGGPWRRATAERIGIRFRDAEALHDYTAWLRSRCRYTLRNFQVAVDCAHGAAYQAAPELMRRLKADVAVFGAEPTGMNINEGCGATHPDFLARRAGGRVGFAFDGDADRCIAVDEDGVPANGDVIMAILARHLKEQGKLRNDVVVTTVMANLGFKKAMASLGIRVVETQVGDRYVVEAMRAHKAVLGGEQSGHIVLLRESQTGDGLLTALKLLEVMASTGRELRELRTVMTEYPQVLRNVRVADKERLATSPEIAEAVAAAEARLGDEGRVLVRPSGTEPVVRVMVEAADRTTALAIAEELAEVVRRALA